MKKGVLYSFLACWISCYLASAEKVEDCPFCDSKVIQKQKIFENNHIYVLYDRKPVLRGHCLIVPKRHVEHFHLLDNDELLSIRTAIGDLFTASQKTYKATSYILLEKNGVDAGQSVPHVHFHYYPRKKGDYSDLGVLARFYLSPYRGELSQEELDKEKSLLQKSKTFLQNKE